MSRISSAGFFAVCFLLFRLATGRPDAVCLESQQLITGGEDAPKGRFPYYCSLRQRGNDRHVCGCALVHESFVVTAAHCVDSKESNGEKRPLVYVGIDERNIDDDSDNYEKFFTQSSPIIHPRYERGNAESGYDIAIIKLDGNSTMKPIRLPPADVDYKTGEKFIALGFDAGTKSENLQILEGLVAISRKACNNTDGLHFTIKEQMICAEAATKKDLTKGDSGEPVIIPHLLKGNLTKGDAALDELVGLVSLGLDAIDGSQLPVILTRVSAFRLWIDCIILKGDETECRSKSQLDVLGSESSGGCPQNSQTSGSGGEILRGPPPTRDPDCLLDYGLAAKDLSDLDTTCLGGQLSSAPKCYFAGTRRDVVDCFYRGIDSSIHRRTIEDVVDKDGVEKKMEIENVGGPSLSDVECVKSTNRTLQCFMIGDDSGLRVRQLEEGVWGSWVSIGGEYPELPVCVSEGGGNVHCVGRDHANYMWHRRYHPTTGKWSEEHPLKELSAYRPAVKYFASCSCITVIYSNYDNFAYILVYKTATETWNEAYSIRSDQGKIYMFHPPALLEWRDQYVYVFLSLNRFIFYVDAGQKTIFGELPNQRVYSDQECLVTAESDVHCFALDIKGNLLYTKRDKDNWSKSKPIVGPFLDTPSCLVFSYKEIRCYLRSYSLALVEVVIHV